MAIKHDIVRENAVRMNTMTLTVLAFTPQSRALSVAQAKQEFGDRFHLNEEEETYSFDECKNIPIGEETGLKHDVIGVYNMEDKQQKENFEGTSELRW